MSRRDTRLTTDERHARLCEAILEVLALSGGWLSQPQVRDGLGQGYVNPADLAAAIADLLDRGLMVTKRRRKGVGRHGRPRDVYAGITARLVLSDETRDPVGMSRAITLAPAARLELLDYARARFLAARADAAASLEDEAFWRSTAIALLDEPALDDAAHTAHAGAEAP